MEDSCWGRTEGCWGRHEVDSTKAYVMAGCALVVQFMVLGSMNVFGMFMKEMEKDTALGSPSKTSLSVVAAIANGLPPILGMVTGRLVDRCGPAYIQSSAGVLLSLGFLLSSYAENYYFFLTVFSLLCGLAGGCTISPGLAAVGQWFERDRSIAFGLVFAGAALGTTLMPLVADQIKSQFDDWRGPFRLLALGGIPAALAGMMMRPFTPPNRNPQRDETHMTLKEILSNRVVIALTAAGFLFMWGFFAFIVYAVAYAQASGESPYESRDAVSDSAASYIISAYGVTHTVGNVVWGYAAKRAGNMPMFIASNTLCGVTFLAWPWCAYYWSQVLFGCVFGFGVAGCVTCFPAIIADHFAGEQLADVLSTIYVGFGFGSFVGPPTFGLLVDLQNGEYVIASLVTSGCYVLCVVLMVTVVPPPPAQDVELPVLNADTGYSINQAQDASSTEEDGKFYHLPE